MLDPGGIVASFGRVVYADLLNEIRALNDQSFAEAVRQLSDLVERNSGCDGCYGKGLAYLAFLTQGMSDAIHTDAVARLRQFGRIRMLRRNYSEELRRKMADWGVVVEPLSP